MCIMGNIYNKLININKEINNVKLGRIYKYVKLCFRKFAAGIWSISI